MYIYLIIKKEMASKSKFEEKELKKKIVEAMNKKREVSHAIVTKEPLKTKIKLLKELEDIVNKYNLQNVQTEDWGTFIQTLMFFHLYIQIK